MQFMMKGIVAEAYGAIWASDPRFRDGLLDID